MSFQMEVCLTSSEIQDTLKNISESENILMVAIGGTAAEDSNGKGGQTYYPVEGDFRYEANGRGLVLQIPDSIAEALRQQGYRAAQRNMRSAMGAK